MIPTHNHFTPTVHYALCPALGHDMGDLLAICVTLAVYCFSECCMALWDMQARIAHWVSERIDFLTKPWLEISRCLF